MRVLPLLLLLMPASRADDPPPPAPADALAVTGEQLLDHAIALLTDGKYEDALAIAIRAQARYPELAVSYAAVASIAVDQIERRRVTTAPATTSSTMPSALPPDPTRSSALPSASVALPAARPAYVPRSRTRTKRPDRFVTGFEVGAPTGFRAEWRFEPRRTGGVEAMGLRVGGNVLSYNQTWAVTDVTYYLDFRASETWQIEGLVGAFVYFGWTYPEIGAALQYDPKGPLQASAGGRLGPNGSWLPEASVGFLW